MTLGMAGTAQANQLSQGAEPPSGKSYRLCGPWACEDHVLPRELGSILTVQSWPIIQGSRISLLVRGSQAYAVCAAPALQGNLKCVRMNMPSAPGIAFKLANRAGQSYVVETQVSGHPEQRADHRALYTRFVAEFGKAKELLGAELAQEQSAPQLTRARVSMAGLGIAARNFTPLNTECPIGNDGLPVCPPVYVGGGGGGGGGGIGGGGGPGAGEGGFDPCPPNVLMPEPCTPEGGGPGSYPGDDEAIQAAAANNIANGIVFPCPKPDEPNPVYVARSIGFCKSEVQRAIPVATDKIAHSACILVQSKITLTYLGHESCRN